MYVKRIVFPLLVLLISIPTFSRMLRPGVFTTADFHYFRLVEFSRCIGDFQIPCRWSFEAGLGYGEPLFNFYGQLGYVPSALFQFLGASFTDAWKFGFIFSIMASGIAMFFLAKKIWQSNIAALLSAILYMYAPYRAVDVWVRGALPEAMSFVFFPLIILCLEYFFEKPSIKRIATVAVSVSLLVTTHNLSALMFLPFLCVWLIYKISEQKTKMTLVKPFAIFGILTFLLTAFYVLPVIGESHLVDLESTTRGYFDYRGHFAGIGQLLFSRFWGYGGSVFGPEDGLNLSLGLFHWLVPLVAFLALLLSKKVDKYRGFLVMLALGLFYLFLTHNKSTFIWNLVPQMKFIQFPWRFLGIAVFSFSLASGALFLILKKYTTIIAIILSIFTIWWSISFFREDIWLEVDDDYLTTGASWIDQTRASVGDYWPKSAGVIPNDYAPSKTSDYELIEKTSQRALYKVISTSEYIDFPVNYFPGMVKSISGDTVTFEFTNTAVRTIGNTLTIFGLFALLLIYFKPNANNKK